MTVELDRMTIRALIEQSCENFDRLPAIGFVGDLPRTYHEMHHEIQKVATDLLNHNVKKGDRVAILGENSPNWVIAYLATVWIGAVAVPILTGFTDSDTRHILRSSGSVAIFIAKEMRGKIEGMEDSELHTVYSLEDLSAEVLKKDNLRALEKSIQALIQKLGKEPSPSDILGQFPAPEPSDLAAIIYTSGTTGHSKGVMLTHENITSDAVNSIEKFPIDQRDRFLSILPLAHTFECTGGMLCPLSVGATIFYMRGLPTPQKLLSAMETVRPTAVLAVPLIMEKIYRKRILPTLQKRRLTNSMLGKPFFRKKLYRLAGKKLMKSFGGRLRFFMFGGAALSEDVEQFLREAGIRYSTGYGLTEASPIVTINPLEKVKPGSCGQPIPGVELKILNSGQKTKVGEIALRGPNVMKGYFNNEEATHAAFTDDGWLRTGDIGLIDPEGYLFIRGRLKNVIVGPSGENIYPEIIERELLKSSYIQEAIVYESDRRLIAKVYLDYDVLDQEVEGSVRDEAAAGERIKSLLEQVRNDVNARLPRFSHISKIIEHPSPFEKTPTNKVKRYLYIPKAS